MSLSVGTAVNEELESLVPRTPEDLLPQDFRGFVRNLAAELSAGVSGPALQLLRSKADRARAELQADDLNAPNAKARTKGLADVWVAGLRPQLLQAIRRSNADERLILSCIQANGESFCRQLLKRSNVADDETQAFIDARPILLRYFYAHARHSLQAAIWGKGFEDIGAERELSHQFDIDYGIIASYFDGLLSKDARANNAYRDLTRMLSTPSDEAHAYLREGLEQLSLL